MCALLLACSPTESASPTIVLVTPSPSIGPSATPAPTPTATPIAVSGDTWTAVENVPDPNGRVSAVTAGGPGWVAVGSAPKRTDLSRIVPAAWSSPDGRTWTRSPQVPAQEEGEMVAVAADETGIYAAGVTGGTRGVVWRSMDGLSWEVAGAGELFDLGECYEGCPSLTTVSVGPAGVLVAGTFVSVSSGVGVVGTLWFTGDGGTWTRLSGSLDTATAIALIAAATAGASGFVLLGHLCDPDCRPWNLRTWTSPDGLSWSGPHDLPDGAGVEPIGLAVSDDRLVVLGSRCAPDGPCGMVAWASSDGVGWSQAPIDGWTVHGRPLAGRRGSFVLLGLSDGRGSAWTSADGTIWQRGASRGLPVYCGPGIVPPCATLFDSAVGPLGALAVGEVQPATKGDFLPYPVVWLSPGD